jgi:hypothetical protein
MTPDVIEGLGISPQLLKNLSDFKAEKSFQKTLTQHYMPNHSYLPSVLGAAFF